MKLQDATVLIVEDGDEYLDNFSRWVPGPRYLQAHSAQEAIATLASQQVHLILLDMRFDRTPRHLLLGDHGRATRENGGDSERGWRHLALHQGLYVLAAVRAAGHREVAVLIAYDFSRELRRFEALAKTAAPLDWLPDAATAQVLTARMAAMLRERTTA